MNPDGPVAPVNPDGPVAPDGPLAPVDPVDPVGPVGPMHAVLWLKVMAEGQPGWHATPAGQQVNAVPLPHGVVLDGQPQKLSEALIHATPVLQHRCPHGVVPAGQQQEVLGSEQV